MLLRREKEESLVICGNLDEPRGDYASDICQAEKEKYCMTSFCVELKKIF